MKTIKELEDKWKGPYELGQFKALKEVLEFISGYYSDNDCCMDLLKELQARIKG